MITIFITEMLSQQKKVSRTGRSIINLYFWDLKSSYGTGFEMSVVRDYRGVVFIYHYEHQIRFHG